MSPTLPEPWTLLDLSKPPRPPRWVVADFLARGWITIFHGKPGSGKSLLYQTLLGAAMGRQPWLGRRVDAERFLILDEENPADIVIARLKSAGYQHTRDRGRVWYFDQIGCHLGVPAWNDGLVEAVDQFRPDVIVVDSMFAATTATWANETINPLFSDVFKPLVKRYDCALWLNHHDNKAGGDMGVRMSGGDQWMAQVDRQIGFDKMQENAEMVDGQPGRVTFPIRLVGGKSRQGTGLPDTYVSVESEADPGEPDLPVRMWLELADPPAPRHSAPPGDDWRPTWYVEQTLRALAEYPGLSFNGLHGKVGKQQGYLRKAIDLLIEEGRIRVEPGPRNAQLHYLADSAD